MALVILSTAYLLVSVPVSVLVGRAIAMGQRCDAEPALAGPAALSTVGRASAPPAAELAA